MNHIITSTTLGLQRRSFLAGTSAAGLLGLSACASGTSGTSGNVASIPSKAKVVVIGGGYGGATAAKYVRMLSDNKVDVVLIEPNDAFVSCPISNLVIGGSKTIADVTVAYTGLSARHGITVVKDWAAGIDAKKKTVTLKGGAVIGYDKLVVSPGVDLMLNTVEGLTQANADGQVLHAWKAGAETVALRRQLQAMPDGGTFAITVPLAPYRCPPGPYERACQVAWYFKNFKPKSKVLILDANPDVTSKAGLFKAAWNGPYKGYVEHTKEFAVSQIDAKTGTLMSDAGNVKASVLNVLPGMRAGAIAVQSGLNNMANNRWVGVNYQTFESTVAKDVFVIGDSIQIAPGMPKSGHMANSHAKVAAAAIVAQLAGWEINPAPMLTNTCYSFIDDKTVVHVASVHGYVAEEKTFKTVAGSGGLSPAPTELEGIYAMSWAKSIWADALA